MGQVIPFDPNRAEADRTPEPLWREVLGRRLRDTRRAKGERLVDVAGRAGVSPQYLSEIERGRKEPSSEMIAAVCGALGIGLGRLLGGISADLIRAQVRPGDGTVRMAA
ncbi:MAG: helix-turn-helix transcriptional regulator [Mycolicibacterium neoaurum]|uniref:helix-turn-helix domain-containing protein n=1 Tax=Mycolicibacterium neoaurum TaxID=1795 RepID=UPI002FF4E647